MVSDVIDDVYYLRNVCVWMMFINDSYIGIVQQFSDSVGMNYVVNIWRNYDWVIQIQLQYIFEQDWVIEYVINWNVKEVLDLFSMQIYGENVVNVDVGQEVSDNFCGNWYMGGMYVMVLMCIVKVGDNGGDMICGSMMQGINYND